MTGKRQFIAGYVHGAIACGMQVAVVTHDGPVSGAKWLADNPDLHVPGWIGEDSKPVVIQEPAPTPYSS